MTCRAASWGVAVLASLVLGGGGARPDPAGAQDLTAFLAPYLRARDEGAVGEVRGRAQGDPVHPTAPPVPYEGLSVMLLPRSPAFEAEATAIKAHLRDSLKTYMGATAELAEARATYERALLAAGGGELIRGEVSDVEGQVQLSGVPAGDWLLFAWRAQVHAGKPPRPRPGDTTAFRDVPVSEGYSTVTYWLLPVMVQASQTTPVELNDRNVWLTGIHEDVRVMEGPPKKSKGSGRHR